jgi:osmotically-inducible protein OsmY
LIKLSFHDLKNTVMANNNRNQYNRNWDQSRERFDQDNEYNQNRNWRESDEGSGNYGEASYGNQYGRQKNQNRDYNTGSGNYGSGGNYSNEYGGNYGSAGGWNNREDYDHGWENTGNNYGGSYSNRNMRRNYGNMNSGQGNRDWWDRTKDEVSSWFGDDDAERRRTSDKRMGGEHKGKGPKGYTRSDDRIREEVHDRLADDPYVDASDIEVKVENCEVVLTGNVSDRDQKRRAEDVVESVSGVRHVENRLRVGQEHSGNANANQRRGNYTGTTNDVGGIGNESGTTNEIIRNTGNMNANR